MMTSDADYHEGRACLPLAADQRMAMDKGALAQDREEIQEMEEDRRLREVRPSQRRQIGQVL